MAYPLPLRPVPVHRETLPSFLSRFAALNGASLANFATDLGYEFRRFLRLEEGPVNRLAEAAELSPNQLGALLSWTGRPIGDVRTEFRGEVFTSKAVRSPAMRACPVCLREDVAVNPANPIAALVFRGDWLLREVSICCRHQHSLVTLWDSPKPLHRYDVAAQMTGRLDQVLTGELYRPLCAPSTYDLWLDHRLEAGEDPTFLNAHGLFAATTMCSLLGTMLVSRSSEVASHPSIERDAGFRVLAKGEAAFRYALDKLVERANGNNIGPRSVFGKLYDALDDYLSEGQFDPFRNALRECIKRSWPLASGETVLGQVIPERLLHSPASAAKEIGVTAGLVEKFLIEAGAVPKQNTRPSVLRTFDAVRYAELLAEIPTLVGPIEMQTAIGATKAQLRSLRDDGILVPRIRREKVDSPWRLADGVELMNELTGLSAEILRGDPEWEDIQSASKRKRLRVGDIIKSVRNREIALGRPPGAVGYRDLMVFKSAIDALAKTIAAGEVRNDHGQHRITASVFARELGIRTEGWFRSLVEAGCCTGSWGNHPVTNVRTLYVSDEDILQFNRRFITLQQMQAEFGLHRHTCLSKLRAAAVRPFSRGRQTFGPLYERSHVINVLRPASPTVFPIAER